MENPSIEVLRRVAGRLTYKPGHKVDVRPTNEDVALISVSCSAIPDASDVDSLFGLTIIEAVKLSTILTEADALQAFAHLIASFELHEAAEFLQLGGQTVFLPHRAGAEYGDFCWADFERLSGRYLRAFHDWTSKQTS